MTANRKARRAGGVARSTPSFVCTHVAAGTRPVLLVSRPEGDWCLLCGGYDHYGVESYRMMCISHLTDDDPSLLEVMSLRPGHEAERADRLSPWQRRPCSIDG